MLGARRRRPIGLAASILAGIAALAAAIPAVAGAQASGPNLSDPNPTTTNVPYLAWRGEPIRLVKCADDLTDAEILAIERAVFRHDDGYLIFAGVNASFFVEEWGGTDSSKPQEIENTEGFFISGHRLCVRADFTTNGAGLARIKLAVNFDTTKVDADLRALFLSINQRSTLLSHQFLAGWMTLSDPALTELPLGGDGANDPANPTGTGILNTFWAGDEPQNEGVLKAVVKGTLPAGGDFGDKTYTLPDDWPALAQKYATDANVDNENPQYRWDIHDDSALESSSVEGHPADAVCDPSSRPTNLPPTRLDAVDNCQGGYAFSRAWDADGPGFPIPSAYLGLSDEYTVGPFDPQREDETFLPDGNLSADDAPMPSTQINFTIGANKGGTDISGVGSFHKTNKNELFSADRDPNANRGSGDDTPHNLYAPFYSAYVPATGAPEAHASGTDGGPGNDFSGFLVGDGQGGEGDYLDVDQKYDYWDIAHVFGARNLVGYPTKCLRRDDQEGYHYRSTPYGPQKVAVYTDEHGEAYVNYNPGLGFWFDALLARQPNELNNNLNGGCDLKYLKDGILGTADITADAKYPYQPVSATPDPSNTITKTVKSLFAKYLAVYPKGYTPELSNARIVVVHAQDIDGSPFADEEVCFSDTSASSVIKPFTPAGYHTGKVGPYWVDGTHLVDDPYNSQSDKRVCLTTNYDGNAAVEVLESQGAEINVMADFTAEGLLRDVHIPFGQPPSIIDPGIPPVSGNPGTPPPTGTPVQPPAQNAAGNTTPSQAEVKAAAVQVSAAKPHRAARATVRFARVVNSARGSRYLSIRLRGRAGSARVRIRLIGYDGKTVKSLTRRVAIGRTVRLRNVRIPRNVRDVTLNILG
jgi:hypothetical protein